MYIGGMEKNLKKVFSAAASSDARLFFDEADAQFGKRSVVRGGDDRYANIDVTLLLRQIEALKGLAIVTTNLREDIDETFSRRFDSVIEFPIPDEE